MIDGCLVINLPHRIDRWKLFQKQMPLMESLGLVPERLDAVYGRSLPGFGEPPWFTKRGAEKRANAWAGKAGCTLSHRQAMEEAKRRGWKRVLILEDDVTFQPHLADQWPKLQEMMHALPLDWVAIYLYGHHPVMPVRAIRSAGDTTCYELCGAYSTAAYILNGNRLDALLDLLPQEQTIWKWTARYKTIDRWLSQQLCLLGRVYAVSPLGIMHSETPSDITTAGEAYDAPSFNFDHLTFPGGFSLLRRLRCWWSGLMLGMSFIRYVIKHVRGL